MENRVVIVSLFTFLAFLAFFGSGSDSFSSYDDVFRQSFNGGVNRALPRRSLLSDSKGPETALVATPDGTIHLLELGSMKPIWAFSSGPAIYSSYQAPLHYGSDKENASGIASDYYIDCGEDWELYAHNRLGKLKLMQTLEEYICSTPQIAEDGGIVLGSKKTTAFLVDAKTGRLIHTYKMSDSQTPTERNKFKNDFSNTTVEEKELSKSNDPMADELPLYITRTDYTLTSFASNTDGILWNMSVAEIGAAFLCQEIDYSFDGILHDSDSLPSFNMPLPCHSRVRVHRFRNYNMLPSYGLSGLFEVHHREMTLPASISTDVFPSQPHIDKVLELLPSPDKVGKISGDLLKTTDERLPSLPVVTGNVGMSEMQEEKVPSIDKLSKLSERILFPSIFSIILGGLFVYFSVPMGSKFYWIQLFSDRNPRNSPSKKKKTRKSGKSGGSAEKRNKDAMLDGEIPSVHNDENIFVLNFNQPGSSLDGRKIGKLFVSTKEIGKGSNGTVVLEGIYEGRPVAVKRLVRAHHDIASKEIQNLIASDRHPNIVRWYGVEQDQDFIYLSLERCICSLNDIIDLYSNFCGSPHHSKNLDTENMTEYRIHLDSVKSCIQDTKLWKGNGYPTPDLLKLMRDVVFGLAHLHELGIIHRDLKPQNILIIKERLLCAKLSDMGISRRLVGDTSSLGQHATGCGSSGWQAPEQLLHGRQTRAVDLFSLGCVLFFCVTGGRHPFGNHLERDINIAKNQVDLFLVEHIPEALDLFLYLLDPNPEIRPKPVEVLAHPLFWSAERRLSFICDTSDKLEPKDREPDSELLKAIESTASVALGGKWNEKMDPQFISNIGQYRRYKFDSVRDLLRVIRNKRNHYRELPADVQEILGSLPEGYDSYFVSRFPKLLIEVYKVMRNYCREEEVFKNYFVYSES